MIRRIATIFPCGKPLDASSATQKTPQNKRKKSQTLSGRVSAISAMTSTTPPTPATQRTGSKNHNSFMVQLDADLKMQEFGRTELNWALDLHHKSHTPDERKRQNNTTQLSRFSRQETDVPRTTHSESACWSPNEAETQRVKPNLIPEPRNLLNSTTL